jgi:hypothetical protein
MKTQTITLKITVSDDYDDPKYWNWGGILDLGAGESCEMLDYSPVDEVKTAPDLTDHYAAEQERPMFYGD